MYLFYCLFLESRHLKNKCAEQKSRNSRQNSRKNAGTVSSIRNFVFEETYFDNSCYYSKCTYIQVVKYIKICTVSVQILKYKAKAGDKH